MSPIDGASFRRWAAIAAAAFALRAAAAVVTETHPIFPAYYYTDAKLIDAASWEVATTGRYLEGTISQRVELWAESRLYLLLGHRPLAAKLLGALAASIGVALLSLALASELGLRAAWIFGLFVALWPSNVFFTSQNMKDPWVLLFSYASLSGAALSLAGRGSRRDVAFAAACLALTGLLRAYVLGIVAFAIGIAAAAAFARRKRREAQACVMIAAVGLLGYKAAAVSIERALPVRPGTKNLQTAVIPVTYDARLTRKISPTSPKGIEDFRRIRQDADQTYARVASQRRVDSQLFFDQKFDSWLDVAAFLPKASFYVLFMPLPGLYPIAHKLGRALACVEDAVLLALALVAVVALTRRRHLTETTLLLLLVFAGMTAGSALFEFDLGSASRHRILYLPLLLCFAFTLLPRDADGRA